MRIIPATPEHATGIFEVATSVRFDPATADGSRGFLVLPGTPAWWADVLAAPTASRVAVEGGTVLGFVYAVREPGDVLKVDRIAVLASHAGRGIAQRLLDAALAAAGPRRAYALIMHAPVVNRRSIAFFRDRNGFRPTRGTVTLESCTLRRYERP